MLERRFNYHQPNTQEKVARHQKVRETCRLTAREIVEATGQPSREQAYALARLEEAMYWANAAIAREIAPPE